MSHRALSHAEFAAQGGGSRRFADATEATGGYYVSDHPDRGGEYKVDRDASAVDVAHHWSRNRDRAISEATDPQEVYQGLWKHEGRSYLDVSQRVGSFREAVSRGLENKQEAVYDANRGASVFLDPQGTATPSTTPTGVEPRGTKAHYKVVNKNGTPEYA